MTRISLGDDLKATVEDGCLTLSGELQRDNAAKLLARLDGMGVIDRLMLDDFDIADGVAATQAVNMVRHLLASHSLSIYGAPQVLAHNLYRTGLLREGRITLLAMREDEPYG